MICLICFLCIWINNIVSLLFEKKIDFQLLISNSVVCRLTYAFFHSFLLSLVLALFFNLFESSATLLVFLSSFHSPILEFSLFCIYILKPRRYLGHFTFGILLNYMFSFVYSLSLCILANIFHSSYL